MSKIKKEVIVILFFVFSVLVSINAFADEVGCCTNPGAAALTCTTERLVLRDAECCPKPESSFPSYYKSSQNPYNPTDYNDCTTNFFFINTACSAVDACALGCCCSELGGTIKAEAQCKGTGLTFYKGQTDCNAVCPVPQCSDSVDNDNNGCADFGGGDLGCASAADTAESGGSCIQEGVGCNDANYAPKLSNLVITPAKGERKFLLTWQDECSGSAVSYDILRCKENGCTNFVLLGTTNTNAFEDASEELLFDTIYTYQVKVRYNLQTATPTITGTGALGNIDCLGVYTTGIFCLNNSAYYCDTVNKLIAEGTKCSSEQVCVVSNNQPSCIDRVSCNYDDANPFGLYYTLQDCETNKYCFYDRSYSTVNSCFSCDPSMACYDYKTEDACLRDNCKTGNCIWKNLANQIGIGVCVSTIQYNCQWCDQKGTATLENLRAYNEVFDICTKEKSEALSEGSFNCYFLVGKSKNCNNVVCTDYATDQCSNVQITHDENNKITNPSNDDCNIKVCQNINNLCVKNADGDNSADCTSKSCENDYFAPNATLLPIMKKGVVDSLVIQIYDKTSINGTVTLKTSTDYNTYLCVEPCGTNGHPYSSYTKSRSIIISNLNAFDGSNGSKLLSLNEGINVIRYYSQDPSKNIEEVKKIPIEAHSNTSGPKVFVINVTDGTEVNGKIYTSNQKPTIDVQFFEPAIVTLSRLINNKTGLIISFSATTQPSNKASFAVTDTLPNGDYIFELNAKNEKNIFMDTQFKAIIVIDNNKPTLNITPSNGTVFNTSLVSIKLAFNKEINLDTVKINSEEIKDLFSTIDNKIFTTTINLSDGNKNLDVKASDFAKNQVNGFVSFIVDANPTTINLVNPVFGVASKYTFDIVVETDDNADCRYSLDNNFEYEFMDAFTITGGTSHTITSFNKIASGDTSTHKLYVKCKAQRGIAFNSFDINVDSTPPQLISVFAYPNPVIEKPSTTKLNVESNEPVICKFSSSSKDFNVMEGKFEGYDNNTFKTINKQDITVESEGDFLYYVACKNKAELISDVKEIPFKVNLSIPISIISHTPEYFNSTNVILAIETNKKAQCQYSETDATAQTGELFGTSGYSHTKNLLSTPGKHTYYVVCKDQYLQQYSDVKSITFTVDTTAPTMLFVNDTSTLELFPEATCNKDKLRVKWLGEDKESNVREYSYSVIKKHDNKPVVNSTKTFWYSDPENGDEWRWVEDIILEDNTRYFFSVKSINFVNLTSDPKSSDGISVNTTVCKPSPICGDSEINQAGEECDSNTFGSINSCLNYTNFIGGTLKCTNDCKLDTSSCTRLPDCGNGELDPSETCDGTNFGQIDSCTDYNASFSGGTLKCTSTCQLDTSSCIEKPKCGNGYIDIGETCDGINLGPLSGKCIDYNPSTFTGGNISCNNCKIDTSKCQGIVGSCGDGTINIGESCDGTNFGQIDSCTDYNASFSGGTLKCTSTCQLDTSSCIEKPKCGNNLIDKSESCDTNNLGLNSNKCIDYSLDFKEGTLKCTNDCKLDTSSCTKAPTCGNKRLDTGELCDGTNFGNLTDLSCSSYSSNFVEGALTCNNCKISTENCKSNVTTIVNCKDRGECKLNESCSDNSDCESKFCFNNKCTQPTCNDGVKNQGETSIDCGGPCSKCQINKQCNTNSDCQSNFCSFGFCKPQDSCFDGKLTNTESDVDCGGACPTKCFEGRNCGTTNDCDVSLQCFSSRCKRCAENDNNCNGIPDDQEIKEKDTDGDEMTDEWEIQNNLNPNDPNDASLDNDNDGLTNLEEYNLKKRYGKSTDPNKADTDGDGFSDKEEIDKGTNPTDANDFPKSNLAKIILFVLGIVALILGFGYLAYRSVQRKKEERFVLPRKEAPSLTPQIKPTPLKQKAEELKLKESLKKKEEEKEKERKKLFETFGKEEKEKLKEKTEAEIEPRKAKEEKKPIEKKEWVQVKIKKKPRPKKPKEDVFIRLKEIAKESKKRKNAK